MEIRKRGDYTVIEDIVKARQEEIPDHYNFNYKESLSIIRDAIEKNTPITIIGDYDADGISASVIMYLTIKMLGASSRIRLPLRFAEGYGMNGTMIDEIDSGLVITVDNGITCHDPIKKAKDKGLTVLVTDHHLPSVVNGVINLPGADCIIDPHVEEMLGLPGYDYHDYCGAGIALKLSEALTDDQELLTKLTSIASIATVADAVPMTGDNKRIVKMGINAIAEGQTTQGILQLFAQCGFSDLDVPAFLEPYNVITSDILGYKIGPCINAPSRLVEGEGQGRFKYVHEGGDGAKISMACMLADTSELGRLYAGVLAEYNNRRKEFTESGYLSAKKEIQELKAEEDRPLVLHLKDIKPGIIGIIAGKLCDEYHCPVIILTGEGECHGSCRSPEGINIKDLLDRCNELLISYGGHEGAAGLSLQESDITAFRKTIQSVYAQMYGSIEVDESSYFDLAISAKEIPHNLEVMCRQLMPFGSENEEPVFLIDDFLVSDIRILKDKHLKLSDSISSAMLFNCDVSDLTRRVTRGSTIRLLGTLSYNVFRGRATPQINIQEIVA